MSPRRSAPHALAILAALALPLLAGCLTTSTGGEITARDAAAMATPRAQQWQGDAVLMVVAAFELPAVPGNGTFGDSGLVMNPDANPGNGRAPQWFLAYHSPAANRSLEVVAYGNGTVIVLEEPDGDRHAGHDLAAWQVDSPQAVAVAREDANFSAVLDRPGNAVAMALSPPNPDMDDVAEDMDEDPFWILMAGSPMGGNMGAVVIVNARNGSRISVPGDYTGRFSFGDGNVEPRLPEDYTFTGTLTPVQPEAQHAFDVPEGYTEIVASLSWDGALPTDAATLEILGPDGHAHAPTEEEAGDGSYNARFAVEGAGEHVAVVRLSSSAPVGVSTTYGLSLLVVPG